MNRHKRQLSVPRSVPQVRGLDHTSSTNLHGSSAKRVRYSSVPASSIDSSTSENPKAIVLARTIESYRQFSEKLDIRSNLPNHSLPETLPPVSPDCVQEDPTPAASRMSTPSLGGPPPFPVDANPPKIDDIFKGLYTLDKEIDEDTSMTLTGEDDVVIQKPGVSFMPSQVTTSTLHCDCTHVDENTSEYTGRAGINIFRSPNGMLNMPYEEIENGILRHLSPVPGKPKRPIPSHYQVIAEIDHSGDGQPATRTFNVENNIWNFPQAEGPIQFNYKINFTIKFQASSELATKSEQECADEALLAFAQEKPQYASELDHWNSFRPVTRFPPRERERLKRFATSFMRDAQAHVQWGNAWTGLIPIQRIATFLGRKQSWFYTAEADLKKIDEKSRAKRKGARKARLDRESVDLSDKDLDMHDEE